MKIYFPSTFILTYMYVKAKMIVHTFMIELDQPVSIINQSINDFNQSIINEDYSFPKQQC